MSPRLMTGTSPSSETQRRQQGDQRGPSAQVGQTASWSSATRLRAASALSSRRKSETSAMRRQACDQDVVVASQMSSRRRWTSATSCISEAIAPATSGSGARRARRRAGCSRGPCATTALAGYRAPGPRPRSRGRPAGTGDSWSARWTRPAGRPAGRRRGPVLAQRTQQRQPQGMRLGPQGLRVQLSRRRSLALVVGHHRR